MTENRLPWERQPGESDEAWDAFRRYRDQGKDRSMPRLASELIEERQEAGVTPRPLATTGKGQLQRLKRWSSTFHWRERVESWDAELDRRTREDQINEIVEMRKRQARLAAAVANAAVQPALELLERLRERRATLDDMTVKELFQFTIQAGRILPGLAQNERVARGESAEVNVNVSTPPHELDFGTEHMMEVWAALEEVGIDPRDVMRQSLSPAPPSEGDTRAPVQDGGPPTTD
jgi:hypothetical protein